jgi:hypothetical protein
MRDSIEAIPKEGDGAIDTMDPLPFFFFALPPIGL